ncbi:phosphatidylinositol-glycan-specific phospholipase D-like isoform X2 [Dreissena polymorpha]|uniref:phosphatidylinositol-glycan-specific phospholipase D-like isoform X2 n=1 Tax=Dreissena polymorpha TaxID=45954 RepID=UPI00226475A3|nr:phosphatidylinositol-glycan-specific phospholipase D-like isoform X2 [Dreissena polymorpha]
MAKQAELFIVEVIKIIFVLILLTSLVNRCDACGITTHIEISHRAQQYFEDDSGSQIDYGKLIHDNLDALMAGSPYPDSYYDSLCANGDYHDVSEDTHWAPFLNATVNYINSRYPKPWDDATKKLVVFVFGIVSHQVADILWHSLGIDQGFIRAMANMNFFGIFQDAHSVADFGGDVFTTYEMDTSYIPLEEGWYIPASDLYNIYESYYGNKRKVPYYIIVGCSTILFLERLAENLAAKELYADYADQSPFLLDQLEKYFIGGLDDMAGWTNRIWQQTITMFEKGTQSCYIPQSTLFLQCNASLPQVKGYRNPGKNGYYRQPPRNGVTMDDIIVTRELRGVRVKPSISYMEKLKKHRMQKAEAAEKRQAEVKKFRQSQTKSSLAAEPRSPDRVFYVSNDYARLGDAFAVGDLNSDGFDDLVIGAPGYSMPGSPQEGRVYIVYGDASGIPETVNPDLDNLESFKQGQILRGFGMAQSRYGTSVAVVDINLDGVADLAIGAPAFVNAGDDPLQYLGSVFVYFGNKAKMNVYNGAANITIACSKMQYCNLGFSMTVGDVNHDGNPDLLMGAPFAPTGGEQVGMITALLASKDNLGYQYIEVEDLTWGKNGDRSYDWFGYNMHMKQWNGKPVLLVCQPEYRECLDKYNPNCTTYSRVDSQAMGRLQLFYGPDLEAKWAVELNIDPYGIESFKQVGWDADIGSPFADKSTQVIAVSNVGMDIDGRILAKQTYFEQAGNVFLFNTTDGFIPVQLNQTIDGDRRFERFGTKIRFFDVSGDGLDDLIVTAPLRSQDISEEFYGADQGQVYIYNGGTNFPYDPALEQCKGELVKPCPGKQASTVLTWGGEIAQTRFGSNVEVLKAESGRQVFITAQHSSQFARLAGAVGVFNF